MSRLMLCGTVAVLVLAAPVRADDAEDKAVAIVEKLGGSVTRDEERPGKPVVGVNLNGTQVGNADLENLAPLTKLTALYLNDTNVTDAGLKHLVVFKGLTHLFLKETAVTDAGLKELAALKTLELLVLTEHQLTRDGVGQLQKLLPKCQIERDATNVSNFPQASGTSSFDLSADSTISITGAPPKRDAVSSETNPSVATAVAKPKQQDVLSETDTPAPPPDADDFWSRVGVIAFALAVIGGAALWRSRR